MLINDLNIKHLPLSPTLLDKDIEYDLWTGHTLLKNLLLIYKRVGLFFSIMVVR